MTTHTIAERPSKDWPFYTIAALLIAAGAGLRVAGASGDLWLDEIWSLALVQRVSSMGEILWGINHDNNHFLNSMYLYLVGPDASPIVHRGLSIAFGAATVAAAGLACRRHGRAAALAAMLLFAVSYPLVHYGSEARGYSGLVLFSLLCLVLIQRELAQSRWTNRRLLGLAIALGILAHLQMTMAAAVFVVWTFWVLWRRTGRLLPSAITTFPIFLPAIVCALAVGLAIGAGVMTHGFTVGGTSPFSIANFMEGYGGLVRLLMGVPTSVPASACLAGAVVVTAGYAIFFRKDSDGLGSLFVLSVIVLPLAMFVAQLPNTELGRYFLFSGTMLILLVAIVIGRALSAGGVLRWGMAVVALAIVVGSAAHLMRFFEHGRGRYSEVVAMMASNGRLTYSSDHTFRTRTVVEFFSRRLGIQSQFVDSAGRCKSPPEWLIVESLSSPILQHNNFSWDSPGCSQRFSLSDVYTFWGLSGRPWVLYRRVP